MLPGQIRVPVVPNHPDSNTSNARQLQVSDLAVCSGPQSDRVLHAVPLDVRSLPGALTGRTGYGVRGTCWPVLLVGAQNAPFLIMSWRGSWIRSEQRSIRDIMTIIQSFDSKESSGSHGSSWHEPWADDGQGRPAGSDWPDGETPVYHEGRWPGPSPTSTSSC